VQSIMLLLAGAALLMPAVFELIEGTGLPAVSAELVKYDSTVEGLSIAVSVVLVLCYIAGLFFSLKTHKAIFNPVADAAEEAHEEHEVWSVRKSLIALAIAGAAVGLMSEILVGSITEASESIGMSEFFIGVIVVAIVGNAAEHWVAVLVAFKGKMDLAVNIAIGSSAQIALFVAPALVFLSYVVGPEPMPLVFNGFELAAVLIAAFVANAVTQEGESTWYEGVLLLAVYAVLGITFFVA
jgi:Ca2+:H+ antiporter